MCSAYKLKKQIQNFKKKIEWKYGFNKKKTFPLNLFILFLFYSTQVEFQRATPQGWWTKPNLKPSYKYPIY